MIIKMILVLLMIAGSSVSVAQNGAPARLKVFLDCSSTWCDEQYIKTEITIVDFLLDNQAADVHVLITSQPTGSGGGRYQLIFFGQKFFRTMVDTLHFVTDRNATDFENRKLMLRYLKSGLVPFIVKTGSMTEMEVILKNQDSLSPRAIDTSSLKDPWNAWVIRIGADGNMNADANYRNVSFNGNVSANRITERTKIGIGIFWGKNQSNFKYEENGIPGKYQVDNHNWSVNTYLVKSINSHWSWAYEIRASQNTFSNNKRRYYLRPAVEYNIFPYSQVNNKLFTLSYGLTARLNSYFDTTIYNKKKETLFGHRATAYISLNHKWGNAYTGVSYHSYLHNPSLFNLGLDAYVNVRITGGLSVYGFAFGGLTRDQVFLVKGNASPEEVLARRRQLASGYNYYASVGISYRFGSKLNNIVNPRFDRSGNSNED